jgi:pyrimidine-nucleoside phosphorylase
MDEPLGNKMGNFLEIEESLDALEGKGPTDLMEVTFQLAARMAILGGKARDTDEGLALSKKTLASGKPYEIFLQNVKNQGGDVEELLARRNTWRSPVSALVKAPEDSYISRIDAEKIGHAGISLGVGRNRTEDKVSPLAGIEFKARHGSALKRGDTVMTVWAATEQGLAVALPEIESAVTYSKTEPAPRIMVLKEIK